MHARTSLAIRKRSAAIGAEAATSVERLGGQGHAGERGLGPAVIGCLIALCRPPAGS
jgi:hypothetical protein